MDDPMNELWAMRLKKAVKEEENWTIETRGFAGGEGYVACRPMLNI